jgi:hypothetical protein
MKNYLRLQSLENPNLYLKRSSKADSTEYSYDIKGSKFSMSEMDLLNSLKMEFNGNIIMIEPELQYE